MRFASCGVAVVGFLMGLTAPQQALGGDLRELVSAAFACGLSELPAGRTELETWRAWPSGPRIRVPRGWKASAPTRFRAKSTHRRGRAQVEILRDRASPEGFDSWARQVEALHLGANELSEGCRRYLATRYAVDGGQAVRVGLYHSGLSSRQSVQRIALFVEGSRSYWLIAVEVQMGKWRGDLGWVDELLESVRLD